MKYICNEIIVAEGSGDTSYLSSFIDAEFVITNGFDIKNDVVEYLNQASKFKKIIILTDSDDSGQKIRAKLNQKLDNCINIEVSIESCNKNGKHGVAECSKEEIITKLQPVFSKEKIESKSDVDEKFIKLINNNKLKEKIYKAFKTGVCNTKTLIKRLQTLNISQAEIEKAIGEQHGN